MSDRIQNETKSTNTVLPLPRYAVWLWLQLAVACLMWSSAADAAQKNLGSCTQGSVIGANREGDVLALFAPFQMGQEIENTGWMIRHVRIEHGCIFVELGGVDGDALFQVLPAACGKEGEPRSRSFVLRVDPKIRSAQRPQQHLVEAIIQNDGDQQLLVEAIVYNDAASVYQSAPTWRSPAHLWWGLLCLFMLCVVCSMPQLYRIQPVASRVAGIISLAVLTVIFAVVVFLLPDALAYHLGHGAALARAVTPPDAFVYPPTPTLNLYPLLNLALLFGGLAADGHELFVGNRVAAVLCLPLLYGLTHALTGQVRTAFFAAALLAVQPAFLHMARCEFPTTQGIALMVGVGWLVVAARRSGRWWVALAAVLGLVCLLHYRFQGMVVTGPTALLYFISGQVVSGQVGGGKAILPRSLQRKILALVVLVLLALLVLNRLFHVAQAVNPSAPDPSWRMIGDSILFQPRLVTQMLVPMAMVGGLLALRRHWLGVVVAFVAALMVVAANQGTVPSFANLSRYQLWTVPPMVILAAYAIDRICAYLGGLGHAWLGRATSGAIAVLVLVVGLVSSQHLTQADPEARQLHHWRSAGSSLPPGSVVVLPRSLPGSHYYDGVHDVELQAARPDLRVVSLTQFLRSPRFDGAVFWWRSIHCDVEIYMQLPADFVDDCQMARRQFHLEPYRVVELAVGRTDGPDKLSWSSVGYTVDRASAGFYRVSPLSGAGSP